MGMHEAQATKAAMACAQTAHLGQDEPRGIADDDVFNGPLAGNQHSDLSADEGGNLAKKSTQFGRHNLAGRHPSAVDAFEGRDLRRLEARAISCYLMH